MIRLICLAVGISAATASSSEVDCSIGDFRFRQGCFDCWCVGGKAECSNAPYGLACYGLHDDEESTSPNAAAGKHPWDLTPEGQEVGHIAPYPPGSSHRYGLQSPTPKGQYRYPYLFPQVYRAPTSVPANPWSPFAIPYAVPDYGHYGGHAKDLRMLRRLIKIKRANRKRHNHYHRRLYV